MKYKLLPILMLSLFLTACAHISGSAEKDYLQQPSGKYTVGFQDFHWINKHICPDPNYNQNNSADFSQYNILHCHEMMVRIYYPSIASIKRLTPYYAPLTDEMIQQLKSINVAPKIQNKLKTLNSFAFQNIAIVKSKKFPVILFSPGFGSPVQLYENFILELVSHGYIVVGINSTFISGDVLLPNNYTVKCNYSESLNNLVQITLSDLAFVYRKIHHEANSNSIFEAMDLNRIGALGQSLGGQVVASITRRHPAWFQAVVTLDSGIDKLDDSLKSYHLPIMRLIAANRRSEPPLFPRHPLLNKNGFLVTISPTVQNRDYSYHMNFTDYSTMQYMPAVKLWLADYKQKTKKDFLGRGNGWAITHGVNAYLIAFYNMYLKEKPSSNLTQCIKITENSVLQCNSTAQQLN